MPTPETMTKFWLQEAISKTGALVDILKERLDSMPMSKEFVDLQPHYATARKAYEALCSIPTEEPAADAR